MKLKILHSPLYNANLASIPYWEYTKNLCKSYMFTEESKYETKDPADQHDWNKLTGLASHLFDSQKSSHMWAWRYYKGNFEVAPYSHNADGDKILPDEKQITIIPIDTIFSVQIVTSIPTIPQEDRQVMFTTVYRDTENKVIRYTSFQVSRLVEKNKYRVIQSWFGGDSLPQKTVKVYG